MAITETRPNFIGMGSNGHESFNSNRKKKTEETLSNLGFWQDFAKDLSFLSRRNGNQFFTFSSFLKTFDPENPSVKKRKSGLADGKYSQFFMILMIMLK